MGQLIEDVEKTKQNFLAERTEVQIFIKLGKANVTENMDKTDRV